MCMFVCVCGVCVCVCVHICVCMFVCACVVCVCMFVCACGVGERGEGGGRGVQHVMIYIPRSTYRPPMMTELNLERSTWQLVGALYGDRINHDQYDDAVEHMDLMVGVVLIQYSTSLLCACVFASKWCPPTVVQSFG